MTDQHTHYRKAFNSPYLSSADITEPTALTIKCVRLELDKTKKTKELRNTAYFAEKEIRPDEKLKPMVLNVGNSEVMRDMCDSPYIEDWSGPVTVYVEKGVKFGRDIVDGLRIRPGSPFITEEQAKELDNLINEVGADKDRFFNWAGCDSTEKFPSAKLADAVRMLKSKK